MTITTTTLCAIALLITLPLIILLWATESQEQRLTRKVRRYARKGYSQRRTAAELNVTRYRVRCCLA